MTISAANSSIGLIGAIPRSLDAETVTVCTKTGVNYALSSLWERIKDWFFGTNKVAAMTAIHSLATTESSSTQINAFLDLLRCIEPEHREQLKWCAGDGGDPYFMIGDCIVLAAPDWSAHGEMHLSVDDMAQMLLRMHHGDESLLSAFVRVENETVHLLRAPEQSAEDDGVVLHDLSTKKTYLESSPKLVEALEFIGMNRNGVRCDESHELGLQVEKAWREATVGSASTDEEGIDASSALMGSMAQDVMLLVTDMFHERLAASRSPVPRREIGQYGA
ncbi:hypothetical protein PAQ31011_03664 [Pandoraea aquatica]|uniref:Uncharacterized protein n=1 Tax=Pandoraea aquatica TaxID=2508290 RepID=A0A5E4X3Y1_9BURK|nr:hypothetical protein [Pandoraea aquatica]VVE30976.1 hypothetical protein PAQ31011_03664 [Pandoraea aquatica]